jgi:hypothetical protein
MKNIAIFTTLFILSITFVNSVYSQGCCSITSSSLAFTEGTPLDKGSFSIGLSFWHINSSAYYSKSQTEDDPLKRTAYGNNLTLDLEYGLTEFLSFFASIPYNNLFRKSILNNNLSTNYTNSGIGDLVILSKFKIISNIKNDVGSAFFAGIAVKFPTGNNSVTKDGVELPIDLQIGTGAFDFYLWLLFQQKFSKLITLAQSGQFKVSTKNENGYRFGNELNLQTSLFYKLYKDVFLGNLILKVQKRWKDHLEEQIVTNSGRFLVELMPGFNINLNNFNIRTNFGYPIYTYVDGFQLSILFRAGVELRYFIN